MIGPVSDKNKIRIGQNETNSRGTVWRQGKQKEEWKKETALVSQSNGEGEELMYSRESETESPKTWPKD